MRYSIFFLVLFFSFFACSKGSNLSDDTVYKKKSLKLTESLDPVFLNQWAIIKYDLLKFRYEPKKDSKIINHLRLGKIVKIIKCKKEIDTFENQKDHWYFVNYQGQNGWIFGNYLEIYNTYEEALVGSKKIIYSENNSEDNNANNQ